MLPVPLQLEVSVTVILMFVFAGSKTSGDDVNHRQLKHAVNA